jgi:histidine triad (HIT) family protein
VQSSVATCVFCVILARRRSQEIVYEDETTAAFLCEPPATWGHVLVVPRAHRADIWSIPANETADVIRAAQMLSDVLRCDLGAVGVNLRQNNGAKAGQDVFHFHMHVVPRYEDDTVLPGCVWGIPPWKPPSGGENERQRVAQGIRRGVAARRGG